MTKVPDFNPLGRFSWRADLINPFAFMFQFAANGYRCARDIPRERITALVILGHPSSPIACATIKSLGPPDEVLVGIHKSLVFETGLAHLKDELSIPYFGFRWGTDKYLLEIAPDLNLWKVLVENGVVAMREKL